MRLAEETERLPKPMVRIGPKPIIWHIMRHYATFGYRRFMVCLGYKGWAFKEYFLNYRAEVNDVRVDIAHPERPVQYLGDSRVEDWEITLVETGLHSGSTGRLLGTKPYIDTPYFMYTYGDGVGVVDLDAVLAQHRASDGMLTITGVKPSSRFGVLTHDDDRVTAFDEKPEIAEGYVNGGFFCMDTALLDRLDPEEGKGFMEVDLLPTLVAEGEVGIHRHHGFWHSMDTYRDFSALNEMWDAGDAPWKTWA